MKNKIHLNFIKIITLLLGVFVLASCQAKNTPQASLVYSTPTKIAANPTLIADEYPSTPEEVIKAFLIAFPMDQIHAIQYLSPAYVKSFDEASLAKLLPSTGEITGFIIEKGATSTELAMSEILANVAFEDMSSEVQFNLEIQNGRWVINQIITK